MSEPRYKWAHPSDWLNDKIEEYRDDDNINGLVGIIDELMRQVAEDDIQNRFQDEMDADGYFVPVKDKG